MAIKYKKKCLKCNKNYVNADSRTRFVICYDCQKTELKGDIKDPTMKKLFDIPEKYYQQEAFLRSIKSNYLKYGSLSDKQVEVFKRVVKELNAQEE